MSVIYILYLLWEKLEKSWCFLNKSIELSTAVNEYIHTYIIIQLCIGTIRGDKNLNWFSPGFIVCRVTNCRVQMLGTLIALNLFSANFIYVFHFASSYCVLYDLYYLFTNHTPTDTAIRIHNFMSIHAACKHTYTHTYMYSTHTRMYVNVDDRT